MKTLCNCLQEQTVYPISIKTNGKSYLTLYYYTDCSDSVLHKDSTRILYFSSIESLESFCKRNDLQLKNEIVEYDFDSPIKNPINYTLALNNWNLLNTIASTFGMYFDGNCKKYNSLYNLLFKLSTCAEPISSTYYLNKNNYKNILKIFRKKHRFLNLFELYQER